MRISSAVLLVAVVLAPATAHAQAPTQPASIPAELAVALITTPWEGPDSSARLVVGAAPRALAGLAPAGARVIGGVDRGRSGTVVLAFTTRRDSAFAAFGRTLEGMGWRRPRMPEPMERGGFVDTRVPDGPPPVFCLGDSATVWVMHTEGTTRDAYLRVQLSRDREQSPCHARFASRRWEGDLPIPTLRPPPGMTQHGGGGSTGGDDVNSRARLRGATSIADVLAHYAAQLRAAGWTVGTPVSNEAGGVIGLAATDSRGDVWRGALVAVAATDRKLVEISMVREGSR